MTTLMCPKAPLKVTDANSDETSPSRETDIALEFWDRFFALMGDNAKPALFRHGEVGHDFTKADGIELAEAVIAEHDVALNIDGHLSNSPVFPEDVRPSDNFDVYLERLAAVNGAQAVTFTRDYCLRYSAAISAKTRSFFNGYVERRGIPVPGVNAVFIAGRYRATWIGLHNDFCETFLFTLYGRKKMYLWPPHYFSDHKNATVEGMNGICLGHLDISPYVNDAIVIEAEPGDLLFIPPMWWHYNKLDNDEATITLSLGVFSNETAAQSLKRACDAVIESEEAKAQNEWFMAPAPAHVQSLGDVALPPAWQALVERLQADLAARILVSASTNGILGMKVRQSSNVALHPETRILPRLGFLIYLTAWQDDRGLLFANGDIKEVESCIQCRPLIDRISSGRIFTLADVIGGHNTSEEVLGLASWLYEIGAIDLGTHNE